MPETRVDPRQPCLKAYERFLACQKGKASCHMPLTAWQAEWWFTVSHQVTIASVCPSPHQTEQTRAREGKQCQSPPQDSCSVVNAFMLVGCLVGSIKRYTDRRCSLAEEKHMQHFIFTPSPLLHCCLPPNRPTFFPRDVDDTRSLAGIYFILLVFMKS